MSGLQLVDNARVESVARALSTISVDEVLAFEEASDPQYTLVSSLSREVGAGRAAVAAMLVGLASYRLAMRGEEWWECFYREMRARLGRVEDLAGIAGEVLGFLDSCQGSVVGREGKKKRVSRAVSGARAVLQALLGDPGILVERPREVLEQLRAALGEREYRKTVVFSLKIAYYAVRPLVGRKLLKVDIPIPVDARVACASISSEIVRARSYGDVVREPKHAQRAWGAVSKLSGIPVLHLDSILWVTGWAPRDLELEEARIAVERSLSSVFGWSRARLITRELVRRRCA
ncbi:MAG: N-glycosylase/DNA lyase [Aeropyrum sp.]|nr:N-glycosylase/DNA lyase [Aeropyrum sp.]